MPLLLAAVVLSALQCGDESGPWDPIRIEGAATISGVVSGPAGPMARVIITARGVGRSAAVGETRVRTDSTGRFVLPVAAGEYLVAWDNYYYSRRGAAYGVGNNPTGADTIRIAPDESFGDADIIFGGVRLRLRCPEDYRGIWGQVRSLPGASPYFNDAKLRIVTGDSVLLDFDRVPPDFGPLQVWIRPSSGHAASTPLAQVAAGAVDTFRCRPGEWLELRGTLPDLAEARIRVRGSWREFVAGGFDRLEPELLAFDGDSSLVRARMFAGYPAEEIRLPVFPGDTLCFALEIGRVRRWVGGSFHRTATRFVPGPGEILELPEIVESGLLCRLDDPAGSGRDLAGALVLESVAGPEMVEVWIDDYAGSYVAIANLDPGEYYLRYDPSTYACNSYWLERWYPGVRERAAAVPVSISGEGAVTRIEWPLTPAGCLEGTVTELPGAPAGRFSALQVRDGRDSTRALCALPGDYGDRVDFVFRGLEDGTYALSIPINSSSGARLWWYPGTWRASEAELLEIRDHARVRGLRWEWPR